jgi:predicted dehydrogenase
MKFLVVGLGSMGKRRIRNLKYLQEREIIGFDPVEARRKEAEEKYGVRTFEDFDQAMQSDPDALIISTPPDLHLKYALEAAKQNKHFFTEASVVDDGMDELIALCGHKKIVAAPSCTMRFQSSIKKLKELVDSKVIGDILLFTHHSGQYLPDWHPWEDYRKFYVAKRATGAAREIVSFELVWLTWVFGDIDTVSCFKGKLSSLEIDIDDAYQCILKFRNRVLGSMLVDVISRIAERSCEIYGEKGNIRWEWGSGVKVYTADDKKWREYVEKPGTKVAGYDEKISEEMYIDEIETFVKATKGETKFPYTLEEDKRILGILKALEKSSESKVHVGTQS